MAFDYGIQDRATCQILAKQRLFGQQIINTFYYQYEGTSTPSTGGRAEVNALLNNFATDDGTNIVGSMQQAQSQDLEWETVTGQLVDPVRRPPEFAELDSTVGVLIGDAAPPNSAAVITRYGSFGGRRGNGSLHIAGFVSASINGGSLDGTLISLLNAIALKLTEPINGATGVWQPVLWNPGVIGDQNIVFRARPEPQVRVMRRRTVGQGI